MAATATYSIAIYICKVYSVTTLSFAVPKSRSRREIPLSNIWPHAYYIYGGCEICRNARDIDEEGSDCLVGLETSGDLVSWPILRQKEFGGSYDDQMY